MTAMVATLLLRATVLLIVASATAYLLRRSSAAVRHGLWAVTLAGLLVLPAAVLLLPRWEWPILAGSRSEAPPAPLVREEIPSYGVALGERRVSTETSTASTLAPAALPASPVQWLVALWLVGTVFGLARIAVGLVIVERLARRARPIEGGPWAQSVDEAAATFGLLAPVSVRESDAITVPVVYGLWRPAVLVPTSARTWPLERRRAVMLHELAHVRRRDGLVQMIGNLARALYWPHLLVWWAQQRLKAEAERAADDCVIAAGTCGADYARLLLDVARALGRAPQPLVVVAVVERSSLADRLMAVVDPLVRRHAVGQRLKVWGSLAAASVVAALAVAHPVAQTVRAQAPAADRAPVPAASDVPPTTSAPSAAPATRVPATAQVAAPVEPARPAASTAPTVPAAGAPASEGPEAKRPAEPAPPRGRFDITTEEAAALEKKLETEPGDLAARERLLRHYFLDRTPEGRATRARHAFWVIEHAPESRIAGSPEVDFHKPMDPDNYERARAVWLRHLEAGADNVKIIDNAASFFILNDRDRSEALLKHGAELEPENPRWRERLAHLYSLSANRRGSKPDVASSDAALENYEAALKLGTEDNLSTLADASEAALAAGHTDKAAEYARQTLEKAETRRGQWDYGNAIHDGHRVLGHVALLAGDIDGARAHLLESAKTPGSPQLNSFGPELTLARDLLEKGEREAVIEYLQGIRTFWKGREEVIDDWIVLIRAGRTPELERFQARRSSK